MIPKAWEEHLEQELNRLRSKHLLRETVQVDSRIGSHFGNNDYLGLAADESHLNSSNDLESEFRGSILVSGYSKSHKQLEKKLLDLKVSTVSFV